MVRESLAIGIFILFCGVTAHPENDKILEDLSRNVTAIRETQEDIIPIMMQGLYEGIAEKIKNLENKNKKENIEEASRRKDEERKAAELINDVIRRLDVLDHEIAQLENYNRDETLTDKFLRDLQGVTNKAFLKDMEEVKKLSADMKAELGLQLKPVDVKLDKVYTIANERNVVIGGMLYYGRVGSACADEEDICRTAASECRDGKCQCLPGLSSDTLNQVCVEVCANGYGNTYTTTENYAIRGYNKVVLQNTTLEHCKERCKSEDSFVCRSFDWFPAWHSCYLSDMAKMDADAISEGNAEVDLGDYKDEDEDGDGNQSLPNGWEYNAAAVYFQRDCVVDRN